jgi:hypothetical protein
MLRKLFSAVLLTSSLAFGAQAATPPAQVGRLSVRGADILDPSGQPILLRGWNWGHWGSAQAQDAADNAAQGANVVRIPLRWWGFYKGRGGTVDSREDAAAATAGIDPDNLRHLDEMVRWASSAKLWIILFVDSDCGQNGTQDAQERKYCDPQGRYPNGRNFWTDAEARKRFLNVWRFVAARYKDTPYLGMFEPLPEPNPPGVPPAQINAFYDEAMQTIRQVAPGVPFLVGGRSYRAPAIRDAYNPAWKDVVYTGNLFLHAKKSGGGDAAVADFRDRAQQLLTLRNQHKVPVFVQQVGVRSSEDPDIRLVRGVLQHLVQQRIGFTYWEYRGAANPGEYGVHYLRGKQWVAKRDWIDAVSGALRARP